MENGAQRRRNVVTGLLLSLCYWLVALPFLAFTQLGDPADQTPAGVEAAFAARHRNGLIIFAVEVVLYLLLLAALLRRNRRLR